MRFFLIVALLALLISFSPGDAQQAGKLSAQERLDRALTLLQSQDSPAGSPSLGTADGGAGKCGLRVTFEAEEKRAALSKDQQEELRALLAPADFQKSRVLGHFRIWYDTTDINEPHLLDAGGNAIPNSVEAYVDSVGKYFNEVWEKEIDLLGYLQPPFETGSAYYNIYIEELSILFYGQTQFVAQVMPELPPRFTTYIRIDNDYNGFYSSGMDGLKVTAAHEFHHAIQLGSYGYWPGDLYFYEITSTWLEDVLYDDVNDYYQYVKTGIGSPRGHFASPDSGFTSSSGDLPYSRAIWGKFIEKRYSRDIMRLAWEEMASSPSIPSLDQALASVPTTFRQAFLEFALWNANTGPAADTARYYSEGGSYPEIRKRSPIEYRAPSRAFSDSMQAIGSVYRRICFPQSSSDNCNNSPTMLAIVSNVNVSDPYTRDMQRFTYELAQSGDDTWKHLSNGVSVKLNVNDPGNWTSIESIPSFVQDIIAYPNPFLAQNGSTMTFRLPTVTSSTASLYIFTSSLDKVYSSDITIVNESAEPKIRWNGRDESGKTVASGIYFYFIKVDNKEFQGKFSVVRD